MARAVYGTARILASGPPLGLAFGRLLVPQGDVHHNVCSDEARR